MTKTETSELIDHFKVFYWDMMTADLNNIDKLYTDDVFFIDPVHKIRGLDSLHAYFSQMTNNLLSCRFEYLDQLIGHDSAYIKWNMHFQHPKIGTDVITVKGISHIQFNEKIYFHEDVYDLGAMLYEHLPVAGLMTRWIKNRMVKQFKSNQA